MDDTTIGEHPVETFLTFPWSPRFSLHLDKEHLAITDPEAKEVEETIWQALDDVLAIHAEKFSSIGPKDFAAVFCQCHHR